MSIVVTISGMIIPLTFVGIIGYGYLKKIDIFETFIEGCKEGFTTILHILPTLIGLMVAVGILRASNFLDILGVLLSPVTGLLNYPEEAVPLTLMRLVSSSAATGLLLDKFKNHGPDSFIGRFVSIMMSSTETIFYTMSIYFLSVKITKTKYTLPAALLANFAGITVSLVITQLVFGM